MKNKNYGQNCVATSAQLNVIPSIEDVNYNQDYLFTDLSKFGVDPNNRPSDEDEATVKKYAKIMGNGEWFFELSPIYVGIKSLNIFNGEHRRKAVVLAKQKAADKGNEFNPIIHIRFVDDTVDADKKREALNAGKHWNCDDYVQALISAGDKDFDELNKFALDEDHPQLHSAKGKPFYNKAAIAFGSTYKDFKEGYLTGKWNISRSNIRRSEQTYNELVRIKKALGLNYAGQDFWVFFGEAWVKFVNDEGYWNRIKKLPNGIETFYEALQYVNGNNTNRVSEWFNKYVEALEKAERHC